MISAATDRQEAAGGTADPQPGWPSGGNVDWQCVPEGVLAGLLFGASSK